MKIRVTVHTNWENPRWGPLAVGFDLIDVGDAKRMLREIESALHAVAASQNKH